MKGAAAREPGDQDVIEKQPVPAPAPLTGIPHDPRNATSKRRSFLALMLAGAALAVDYTMAMMSIQTLYYALQGPDHLYGLTFGSYDLTGMLLAPVFGFWSDKTGWFKIPFQTGAVVNMAGNLIYAFAYLANGWYMMLIGRLIGGIGLATLGLGSGYIAKTTTLERRQMSLMYYRVSQSIARMAGPFVGYIFLGLPNVNQSSSTALKVFNWYSIPGWMAAAVVAIFAVLFWFLFEDPSEENEHLVVAAPDPNAAPPSPARIARFRSFAGQWLTLTVVTMLIQFAVYSNLFALFAGQYHAVQSQSDQWKVFIGVAVGAASGALIYRRGIRSFPALFNERVLTVAAAWAMFIVNMLFIPWGGSTQIPQEAIYYAGSGIMGGAVVISSASIETVFSKKITQYLDVVGHDQVARWLGFFYMATAAGRFVGPLIVGAVTRIATPQDQTFYCPAPGWTEASDGPVCLNATEACAITGSAYYVFGCILYNAIPFYATMAGIQVLVTLGFHWVTWHHWSYLD